jgi:hypothetical protein
MHICIERALPSVCPRSSTPFGCLFIIFLLINIQALVTLDASRNLKSKHASLLLSGVTAGLADMGRGRHYVTAAPADAEKYGSCSQPPVSHGISILSVNANVPLASCDRLQPI